jgi:urease accessory protein
MTMTMFIANRLIRKQDRTAETPIDSVTLDSDSRYLRRARAVSDAGQAVLIDLLEASFLQHGDALAAEEGLIEVRAAPEELLEIKAKNARSLARLAWHLGNRHTPAEITADAIYIQPDHVLHRMAEGLGASVTPVIRTFQPEMGAYGHGHDH